jgi:hypothetical protein
MMNLNVVDGKTAIPISLQSNAGIPALPNMAVINVDVGYIGSCVNSLAVTGLVGPAILVSASAIGYVAIPNDNIMTIGRKLDTRPGAITGMQTIDYYPRKIIWTMDSVFVYGNFNIIIQNSRITN